MTRDELRAWLDRPARHDADCPINWDKQYAVRNPCECQYTDSWRDWFAPCAIEFCQCLGRGRSHAAYLGETSARTGPDPTGSQHKCKCIQCNPTQE